MCVCVRARHQRGAADRFNKDFKSAGGLRARYRHKEVTFLALRVSDNKYTGRGGTDTGHRLFNTPYFDA